MEMHRRLYNTGARELGAFTQTWNMMGSSPPLGNVQERHLAFLAGLSSADQPEFSRFSAPRCPAKAMSEINFSSDAFATYASSSCRGRMDSTRKFYTGCSALVALLLWSSVPQISTKAACCLTLLGGVSMKSMCVCRLCNVQSTYTRDRRPPEGRSRRA